MSTTDNDGFAVPEGSPTADRQFVTFCLAGETFAVPMGPVQEIIRVPQVARVPLAPPSLDGLANLRGRVLPIVNLRRLFGLEALAHDDATRALVISLGQPLGFVVDRVASVISVEAGEIQPASSIRSIVKADFLTGVIQRPATAGQPRELLLVLDFERLVKDELGTAATAQPVRGAGSPLEGAVASSAATAVTEELRLVSFTVAAQEYAIAIERVQEIVQVPATITAVPQAPQHVLGLISLRDRLLPLVSLRSLFGLPAVAADEQHRIVVVSLPGGAQVGLVTDTVNEVLSVPRQQVEPVPGVLARTHDLQEFESICRLDDGKRLVSIINAEKLLGLPALQAAAAVAATAHGATKEQTPVNTDTRNASDAHDNGTAAENTYAADDDAQVVIFRLGNEEFAVPIMSVQEIVRVPDTLTRVPRTPAFVEGVINLRGKVLPVIDQRARMGMAPLARNDRQRIMVYMLAGLRTGFIVDSVAEVLRISRAHIEPAPVLSDEQARLITQVAKLDGDRRLVLMVDPDQLLQAKETGALKRLQADESRPSAELAALAKAA